MQNIQTNTLQAKQRTGNVNDSFARAKDMLAKSGYRIPDNVKVSVDPKLPFMGYTMPTRNGFNIVVAGGAVESGMLEGLLVHEMSHIYRISTNHPSHNAEILEEAINGISKRIPSEYQQKIIHDLLNDIQDLYADDIAFKVFRGESSLTSKQIIEFLQSWVKDSPVKSKDMALERWTNTSLMAHNARAIAQMTRHRIEDSGGVASKASRSFLNQVPPDIAREFDYFRNTLVSLREEMTANEYRKLLTEYLARFIGIAEEKRLA